MGLQFLKIDRNQSDDLVGEATQILEVSEKP